MTSRDTTVWLYLVSTGTLDVDRLFGALADGTRRDIVRRAIDASEGVAELAEHYTMSFQAVQKHIAILERAGLVTKERVGRRKVVRTNLQAIRTARHLLDRYEELWRGRIDRMADLIGADDATGPAHPSPRSGPGGGSRPTPGSPRTDSEGPPTNTEGIRS